ncbi:MAG: sel1 repeat family protein [Deltaproteobacteria bacterium]|jgi:TPR repeat protein|nr:sel1 repeat family protein [Deltaproteobacteria bacterium]
MKRTFDYIVLRGSWWKLIRLNLEFRPWAQVEGLINTDVDAFAPTQSDRLAYELAAGKMPVINKEPTCFEAINQLNKLRNINGPKNEKRDVAKQLFDQGNIYAGVYLEYVLDEDNQSKAWAEKNKNSGVVAKLQDLSDNYSCATSYLGDIYEYGLADVSKDEEKAFLLHSEAALNNERNSQNELGNLYSSGRGAPQDPPLVAQWYKKAAENGLSVAMVNLGAMLIYGNGIKQNPGEGLK